MSNKANYSSKPTAKSLYSDEEYTDKEVVYVVEYWFKQYEDNEFYKWCVWGVFEEYLDASKCYHAMRRSQKYTRIREIDCTIDDGNNQIRNANYHIPGLNEQ